MSDTVAASILTGSLDDRGPTFIVGPGVVPGSEPALASVASAMHVSGGANAVGFVSGFGSPLLVDFVTFPPAAPDAAIDVQSPTVGGYGIGASPDVPGPAVVGAINAPV